MTNITFLTTRNIKHDTDCKRGNGADSKEGKTKIHGRNQRRISQTPISDSACWHDRRCLTIAPWSVIFPPHCQWCLWPRCIPAWMRWRLAYGNLRFLELCKSAFSTLQQLCGSPLKSAELRVKVPWSKMICKQMICTYPSHLHSEKWFEIQSVIPVQTVALAGTNLHKVVSLSH